MLSAFLLFLYKGHQVSNRQLVQGIRTLQKQDEKYKELVVNEGFTQVLLIKTNSFLVNRQLIWQSPKTILKLATCFIHTQLTIAKIERRILVKPIFQCEVLSGSVKKVMCKKNVTR